MGRRKYKTGERDYYTELRSVGDRMREKKQVGEREKEVTRSRRVG